MRSLSDLRAVSSELTRTNQRNCRITVLSDSMSHSGINADISWEYVLYNLRDSAFFLTKCVHSYFAFVTFQVIRDRVELNFTNI